MQRSIVLLLVCAFVVGCSDPEPTTGTGGSAAVVPLQTWVRDLCTALERFSVESRLDDSHQDAPQPALAEAAVDQLGPALDHLEEAVRDAGIPDIEGGPELTEGFVNGLRAASARLDEARAAVSEIPPGDDAAALEAFQEIMQPLLGYPVALRILLDGDRVDIVVTLADPFRMQTVERIAGSLEGESAVASVAYEDKDASCERFRDSYAYSPTLAENVDCDLLPATLRVRLSDEASLEELEAELEADPGVHDVIVTRDGEEAVFAQAGFSVEDLERLAVVRSLSQREPAC